MSQLDLFGLEEPTAPVAALDPPVSVVRDLFREDEAARIHRDLIDTLPLAQHTARMGWRTIPVPRLEAWFADAGSSGPVYAFGGRSYVPQSMPQALLELRRSVETLTGERFPTCFANLYRSGDDHIPWHADDDAWIGPVVASVSFGEARRFQMRPKVRTGRVTPWETSLGDGDVLVMEAGCQDAWQHRVPRQPGVSGARLNLTFRQLR